MRIEYEARDLVRVAARWNNPKRNYLLVNPLLAKHIPAVPSESLAMMGELGRRVADMAPGCRLVIGFAETATAVGACVAGALGPDCVYYQTTREPIGPEGCRVAFREAHSHAVSQSVCTAGMADALAATDCVVFVDDELTTGKTLRDVVAHMRKALPGFAGKRVIGAALIDRVSGDDRDAVLDDGVELVGLVGDIGLDPEREASAYVPADPGAGGIRQGASPGGVSGLAMLRDPRAGCPIGEYGMDCASAAARICDRVVMIEPVGSRIRVLGTEECMYPALVAGLLLEKAGYRVRCHATTRSPIGVVDEDGYPARSAAVLRSPYDRDRMTYLYNLEPMDLCVVVTDARFDGELFSGLRAVLPEPALMFSVGRA